jgi:hypothetical protein
MQESNADLQRQLQAAKKVHMLIIQTVLSCIKILKSYTGDIQLMGIFILCDIHWSSVIFVPFEIHTL